MGFNGFDTVESYSHFSVWFASAGTISRLSSLLLFSFFLIPFFSFVAPMTAYDDLMPDSLGSADVMYNILGCRHSSLCNILQQVKHWNISMTTMLKFVDNRKTNVSGSRSPQLLSTGLQNTSPCHILLGFFGGTLSITSGQVMLSVRLIDLPVQFFSIFV